MNTKDKVKAFELDLKKLFEKHDLYIDCHGEFVSFLRDPNGETVCKLYEECEPDYSEMVDT